MQFSNGKKDQKKIKKEKGEMMVETIALDKSAFQEVMKLLDIRKPKCKYCGVLVRKNNFGLIAKNVISCKSIVCLIETVNELEVPRFLVGKEKVM